MEVRQSLAIWRLTTVTLRGYSCEVDARQVLSDEDGLSDKLSTALRKRRGLLFLRMLICVRGHLFQGHAQEFAPRPFPALLPWQPTAHPITICL
jgi:hypothetical protein